MKTVSAVQPSLVFENLSFYTYRTKFVESGLGCRRLIKVMHYLTLMRFTWSILDFSTQVLEERIFEKLLATHFSRRRASAETHEMFLIPAFLRPFEHEVYKI